MLLNTSIPVAFSESVAAPGVQAPTTWKGRQQHVLHTRAAVLRQHFACLVSRKHGGPDGGDACLVNHATIVVDVSAWLGLAADVESHHCQGGMSAEFAALGVLAGVCKLIIHLKQSPQLHDGGIGCAEELNGCWELLMLDARFHNGRRARHGGGGSRSGTGKHRHRRYHCWWMVLDVNPSASINGTRANGHHA